MGFLTEEERFFPSMRDSKEDVKGKISLSLRVLAVTDYSCSFKKKEKNQGGWAFWGCSQLPPRMSLVLQTNSHVLGSGLTFCHIQGSLSCPRLHSPLLCAVFSTGDLNCESRSQSWRKFVSFEKLISLQERTRNSYSHIIKRTLLRF